jgi:hypothetical protein
VSKELGPVHLSFTSMGCHDERTGWLEGDHETVVREFGVAQAVVCFLAD